MYCLGQRKQYRPEVPVVSVGNLTMGGTGKTPTVCYIAKLLQQNGYRPCIISRGYNSKAKKTINVVADSKTVHLTADIAGDEPYMLAKMLPGIPVISGKKRYITSEYAIKNLDCNVLILDDGFQHLRVARDLDIVLFDKQTGFGVDKVFPGGDLREPKSALKRADIFIITGSSNNTIKGSSSLIEQYLNNEFPDKPLFLQEKDTITFHLHGDKLVNPKDLPQKTGCFCGIANPQRFQEDLEKMGFSVTFFKTFKDHHHYSKKDVQTLCHMAKAKQLKALITTDKDIVKLQPSQFTLPLLSARLNIKSSPELDRLLLQKIVKST